MVRGNCTTATGAARGSALERYPNHGKPSSQTPIQPKGLRRSVTYPKVAPDLSENNDRQVVETCLSMVQARLKARGSTERATDFVPMKVLADSWNHFGRPELVSEVFQTRVFPFLQALYDDTIGDDVQKAFLKLQDLIVRYARSKVTEKALDLQESSRRQKETSQLTIEGRSP